MKRFLYYLLLAGVILASLFSLLGYFGRDSWFLDMLSHFKAQYTILLLIGCTVILIMNWKVALIFMPFLLLNLVDILPLYFRNKSISESPSIKLVHINLLSSNGEFELVKRYIEDQNPDIIVLEEFNMQWQEILEPKLEEYPTRLRIPRSDNFGIAVYSKPELKLSEKILGRAGAPSIAGELEIKGRRITLLTTHPLPPVGSWYFEHRNDQLGEITSFINSHADGEVILIGDLNTSSFSIHFKKLLNETGLVDSRSGFGILPTWPTWFPLANTTLDHCLISKGISVKNRDTGEYLGSDHLPISVEITL